VTNFLILTFQWRTGASKRKKEEEKTENAKPDPTPPNI
jgi:hypothetical protein